MPYSIEGKEPGKRYKYNAFTFSSYFSTSGTGNDENAEDSDEVDTNEDEFRSSRPTEESGKLSVEEQLEVRERVIQFTLIGLTAVVVAAVNLLIEFD